MIFKTRRQILQAAAVGIAQYLLSPVRANPLPKSLIVGIVPNLSPRSMLSAYQPLREQFSSYLGRPVELFTAPDFKTFYARSVAGEFDLVLMPAHLARLAQIEVGMAPIAQFMPKQSGVLIIAKHSLIRAPSDLHGKRLALVDSLALVTLRAEEWLRAQGLIPGINLPLPLHFTYHNAAAEAVINGNVDAAIVSSAPLAGMPPEMREALRALTSIGEISSNVFMANPKLSKDELSQLLGALMEFKHQPGAGPRFLARYRYTDIVVPSISEMQAQDAYAKRAQYIMATQRDAR
jgi:phosphonate transport system substrate-binding protein